MKSWHFFLAGLAVGVLVSWYFTGHQAARYKVEQIPGALLRIDTWTGKTWVAVASDEQWKLLGEP